MKYAVGIDVGGTNTRVALINEEYKILERIQFSTDSKDPEVTLNKIGEIIKEFGKEVEGQVSEYALKMMRILLVLQKH